MKSRAKIAVVTIIMAAAFGYLLFMGHQEGSMYYFEVAEISAKAHTLGTQKVRVNGEVVQRSVDYDAETRTLTFEIKDVERPDTIRVVYTGSPPDLLQEKGVTVVAEGRYRLDDNTFVSDKLLVKCPSKYEKEETRA